MSNIEKLALAKVRRKLTRLIEIDGKASVKFECYYFSLELEHYMSESKLRELKKLASKFSRTLKENASEINSKIIL